MKISFLVTYYNQAKYVEQSLESIFAIHFPVGCEYEILVGDDGSSDNTLDIVENISREKPGKITIYRMPREPTIKYNSILRASACRLNLLLHAKGQYFCTLDGDDWYCDCEFVSDGIKILEKDKSLSICAFKFEYNTEGQITEYTFPFMEGKIPAGEYVRRGYTPAGACIHRLVYTDLEINRMNEIGLFDDNDIVMATLNHGDMYYINRVIYSYRQTINSTWNSMSLLEKHASNAVGYDVEVNYSSNIKDDIKTRYYDALKYCFKHRNEFNTTFPEDSRKKILEMANKIENSFFLKLINYNDLSIQDKKKIKNFFKMPVNYWMKRCLQAICNKIRKVLDWLLKRQKC
jgi:glycosyltransferase involved in cell wall biosynthesis